ncbi:MAG: 4Fe-4S dicluster domain-containing protein [Clostridium sp.]|uniref:4Fe-4S dicluster domain-containing protein n=1 Tax=Clostridium sp. TaxID=1506 RepID=UPI0025BAC731|nr:4Fe-4S dicluster domain-containing protein [Clostridium sp.]MCF0149226.1 4Fe-4S dicluster domain-containing protein [Clostridium sp.]
MLINLFNNVKGSNKLFTLIDSKLSQTLVKKENLEELSAKEIDESFSSYYENNKNKKVIVKAFSFQPNLNGYGIIVNEKKEELKKGLEKINSLNEVKFVVDKKDKNLFKELGVYGEVIKVSSITDLYDDKLIGKVYGDNKDVVIYDILDVINYGQSLLGKEIERYITVYGSAVKGNKVIAINSNTTYKEVFEELNGNIDILEKIIDGGSLNGTPVYDINLKINEDSKGLLFLSKADLPSSEKYNCINCSKCLRVCPEGLSPMKLMDLSRRNEKEEFIKFGGNKCIDCGLCSFVCPSNIEIAQIIKTSKVFN